MRIFRFWVREGELMDGRSGLAVANPNAGKGRGANDMIKGILQKAQECVCSLPFLGEPD